MSNRGVSQGRGFFISTWENQMSFFWVSGELRGARRENPNPPIQDMAMVGFGVLIEASRVNGVKEERGMNPPKPVRLLQ